MTEFARVCDHWWWWMAATSAQVTMLGAVVLLLDRVLRSSWPQLRAALWTGVMLKLLLPPDLVVDFGAGWMKAPLGLEPFNPAGWTAGWAAMWFAGALTCGVAIVVRERRTRRQWLGTACAPRVDQALIAICTDAARTVGLRGAPRVWLNDQVTGAAVVGVIRPVVVVSTRLLDELSPSGLRDVLLHEFTHIKRRDTLRNLACTALQIIYWFHPVVWLAGRRLGALRELCCDDGVARALDGATRTYRLTLLQVSRPLWQTPPPGALGIIPHANQLVARMLWLQHRDGLRAHGVGRRAAASLAAVALLAAALSATPNPIVRWQDLDGCLQKRFAILAARATAPAGNDLATAEPVRPIPH